MALRRNYGKRCSPASASSGPGLCEGEVAAGSGQPQRAGQLLGAAQAVLPATHPLLRVIVPYELPGRLAVARTAGDPAAFDRGLAEGQAWTIDRAVAAGLSSAANSDASPE